MMSGNGVSSRRRARGGMKGRKLARIGFSGFVPNDIGELVRRISQIDLRHSDCRSPSSGLTIYALRVVRPAPIRRIQR